MARSSLLSAVSPRNSTLVPEAGYRVARGAGVADPRDLGDRRAPLLDLVEAVILEPPHALHHRHLEDLVSRAALQRERAELGTDRHHLVDPGTAPVAGARAVL